MSILLIRGHTLWEERSFGVKHRILSVSHYFVLILEHHLFSLLDSISMIWHHWCPIIDLLLTVHRVNQNIISPNCKGQVSIKILNWKNFLYCGYSTRFRSFGCWGVLETVFTIFGQKWYWCHGPQQYRAYTIGYVELIKNLFLSWKEFYWPKQKPQTTGWYIFNPFEILIQYTQCTVMSQI